MRIHGTLKESLLSPRLKEVLVNAGADAVGNTPEAFANFFQSEIVKWGKVVKAAGIRGE
jgi:tripartite-type tricarboxylate transporter receptor subunit TctC